MNARFHISSIAIAVFLVSSGQVISGVGSEGQLAAEQSESDQYIKGLSAYEFAVIGAGGAGIMVVGLLMDLGIDPKKIAWIDPEFKVGRLGHYYQNVPANAKAKMFVEFIRACKVFCSCNSPSIHALFDSDPEKEYPLKTIVEPLQDITDYLRTMVASFKTELKALDFCKKDDCWLVGLDKYWITAHNVVLATGSHPRTLNYHSAQQEVIPLDEALDQSILASYLDDQDTIAVVGSSHSAVLLLKYLSELAAPRVMNFYKNPIVYPVQMDGWVLHDNTGLMGLTAWWAKEVLEKNPPAKIIRIFNTGEAAKIWMPVCSKVIYAVGFDRNNLPDIPGVSYENYNAQTGVIGSRLFGIGIAFPERITDPLGNQENAVGLPDFMEYALRVVPEWVRRDATPHRWYKFSEFFHIQLL